MLIEELIRLGRPMIESGLDSRDILRLITDVTESRARNFLRHVFVVELPGEGEKTEPAVLPIQRWIQDLANDDGTLGYEIDPRVAGTSFSLPSGGNPLQAQGRYGVPVYPCYDPHFTAFREAAAGVSAFLRPRFERTPSLRLSPELADSVARCVHQAVAAEPYNERERWLGLLVLARCDKDGFFRYVSERSPDTIGASRLHPGQFLAPNLDLVTEAVWAARCAEGAEMGEKQGSCSISGEQGRVLSAYCKVWPWAFATWTCPVPHGGDTDLLIEGIGLSEASYRALTLGACFFNRVTRPLEHFVLREVFSPVADRPAREIAERRNLSDLDTIFGAAFALPVEDAVLADAEKRREFGEGLLNMAERGEGSGRMADRQISVVTGFDCLLPEALAQEMFRLTLVYFSGDISRGDIHLRAFVQDVLPSTVSGLTDLARKAADESVRVLGLVRKKASQKQKDWLKKRFMSVPYLLGRGYGGSHLWTQLERTLHRSPLSGRRVTANAAARMNSLTHRLPDSRQALFDEVLFFLCCQDFLHRYRRELANNPGEDDMSMRPWRDLLQAVEKDPITALTFTSAAELGFACGALIHRFSGWYWKATKSGGQDKDYLKHRVLTFGADLTPETVWKIGLGKMFDVASRYETPKRRLGQGFRQRVGAVLHALDQMQDEVRKQRDEFMAAFWSGYSLQGYDRPIKTKDTKGAGTASGGNT